MKFTPWHPYSFTWRGRTAHLRTRAVALMVFGAGARGVRAVR